MASYELQYNGGMGSNGLTSARHDVLANHYAPVYPESYDNGMPASLVYSGHKRLTDPSGIRGIDIGKLLLSPTRTYAPVVKKILETHSSEIHGLVHCSGGGQTKILHFIDNLHVIKNNLFPIPPLFSLIQEESGTAWDEMYRVFNMGHRLEFYIPEHLSTSVIGIAGEFNIPAQVIGHCEPSSNRELTIVSDYGTYSY
jgi:phosphoribosylformylglycinamidine cyclo-ligase